MPGMFGTPSADDLQKKAEADWAAKVAANRAAQGGINNQGNGVSGFNPNDRTGFDMNSSASVRGQQSGDQQDYNNTTYGGQATIYDQNGRVIRRSSADIEADRALAAAQGAQMRQGAAIDQREQQRDYGGFSQQMGYSDQERARQGNAYNQQQASTNMYRDMATGAGPSLATALMGQGMNNIRAQQTSAAASARGPAGLAMAQQQAAGNMAAQGQQLNAQLGQMRAQEQLGAMQGYAQGTQGLSSAAGQMRAQDQSGAGLYNQARGMSAQNAQAQAQIQQNQNALNDARSMGYEQLRNGIYTQGVQNNINRETMQRAGRQEAAASGDSDMDQMGRYIGTGASVLGSLAMFASDMNNKTDVAPLDAKGAGSSLASALGAIGNGMSKGGGSYKPSGGMSASANAAVPMSTQTGANLQGVADLSGVPASSPGAQMYGFNPGPARGTTGPLMMDFESDERSKQKIASLSDALMRSQAAMYNSPTAAGGPSPMAAQADRLAASQAAMYGAPSPIQETLRTTQPYAFNYKPGIGEDPGQRHVGIMAQDLEKTPAGSTIVKDTPKGKMIDGKQAIGFNLAAAADLQKQIDALKAQKAQEMGALSQLDREQMAMYSAPSAVRGQ